MKVDKAIKAMPWPEPFVSNPRQHFRITLSWPVINHERLLVVTFTQNSHEECEHTRRDFRLVCSKKLPAAVILFKGETKGKRKDLREACGCSPKWAYPEISPKEEAQLTKWLGKSESQNHFLPELYTWVNYAMAAELQRERDARGELRDEDVNLCPSDLPEGMEQYIRANVIPYDNILLYRKGNTRGRCYCCGHEVRARNQRFRQNEITRCPDCGEVVTCYLNTSDRFKVDYVQNLATIQKGTDGKTLFIRQWHLKRDHSGCWMDISSFLEEICRYAIRGDKVAKWQHEEKSTWYYSSYRYTTPGWKRMRNHSEVYDGSYYFYCPENWQEVFAGTSLQYCTITDYLTNSQETKKNKNVIRFLMDWAKYPALEKFWKAGYTALVHEHVSGLRKDQRHAIRWNRPSIREALRFPVRMLKIYQPEEWTMARIQKTKELWEAAEARYIQEKDIPEIVHSEASLGHISDALKFASAHKILRYIAKGVEDELAKRKKRPGWYGHFSTPDTYRDYIKDCLTLRLDLSDKGILFPPDLEAAHQRTISQVKYQVDEAKRELFAQEVRRLKWMEWEKDGLIIRLPVDHKELIAEGSALHHCVAGYADRMANGKTTILLIRRTEDPDTPFFTLEWLNDHVQQCRTTGNRSYVENMQVKAFVDEWVTKIAKKGKKKKTASSAA